MNIPNINKLNPKIVQEMSTEELNSLAIDIRGYLIDTISVTGGHIGANLGVIELTLAIHHVFDSPNDKIIFDTGHQGYTHKIVSGRAKEFSTLNKHGGMSRFITRAESIHDIIDASHAGTSLSMASGIAFSNTRQNNNNHVIAVIGDGSLVEGLAFEGLNYIPALQSNLIVVINDNGMAIAPNVGGVKNLSSGADSFTKSRAFFEGLGLNYQSVANGHDISELVANMKTAKEQVTPTVIHVKTQKGRGLAAADSHPYKMHFSMPFNPNGGDSSPTIPGETYSTIAARHLKTQLEKDKDIILITPATPYASSLDDLIKDFPDRVLDVGMAEQHAVVMASGMALEGLKPIVCIQTTFMQRAFDQLLHDVCFMELPVTLLGVRSGFAGFDSPTHHGLYDIPYLRSLPNMQLCYPVNSRDLSEIIEKRMKNPVGPMVILLPYENIPEYEVTEMIEDNGSIRLVSGGEDGIIFCLGNQLNQAAELKQRLQKKNGEYFSIACVRNIKPLDSKIIIELCLNMEKIITMEESTLAGGFGSAIGEILTDNNILKSMLRIGIPDVFVPAGDKLHLNKSFKLDVDSIYDKVIYKWSTIDGKKDHEQIN